MVRGPHKKPQKINKKNYSHKQIKTGNQCLKFVNHRFKNNALTNLDFKIRRSNMTEPFDHEPFRYSQMIAKLKPKDWAKIKQKLIKKFKSKLPEKRSYVRTCKYDIDGGKITKRQSQALEFEQQVIKDYQNGYDIQDFIYKYGKNKLRRIKRIVFSSALNNKDDPTQVLVKIEPKVKAKHVDEILKIATHKDFHGGCKAIKHKLEAHPDLSIRINLCENTIRKVLRRKRIFYKNLKIVRRTVTAKKRPTYQQKKDLAEIICFLLYKNFEFQVEDEVYMVSLLVFYRLFIPLSIVLLLIQLVYNKTSV